MACLHGTGTALNNPYVICFLWLPAIAWHPSMLFDFRFFGPEILLVSLIQHSLVLRVVVLQAAMSAASVLLFLHK